MRDPTIDGMQERPENAEPWLVNESFQDSYGTTWYVRKLEGWQTVQLLATIVPIDKEEPISYGFAADDFPAFAEVVARAAARLAGSS
jgi:hypothetical protein